MKEILPRILLALAALGAWAAYESTRQSAPVETTAIDNVEILSDSEGPLKTYIIAENDTQARHLSQSTIKIVR